MSGTLTAKASSSIGATRKQAGVGKPENFDQIKSAYFAKMQTLNKKFENERLVARVSKKDDSQSRSKSPMQPGRNMPRQMPQSHINSYVPAPHIQVGARKSLSKGKTG